MPTYKLDTDYSYRYSDGSLGSTRYRLLAIYAYTRKNL